MGLKQQETWGFLQTAQPTLPHLGTHRYLEDFLVWVELGWYRKQCC